MKIFTLKYLSIFLCNVIILSCSGAIHEPNSEQLKWAKNQWPGLTIDTLLYGRNLYITKCTGCHSAHPPGNFSSEQWTKIVPMMARKSKLLQDESTLLIKYLLTMSKQEDLNVVTKK